MADEHRPATAPGLRIGQVSELTGLHVKTIRFYCDQGLLNPSARSAGGYRLFNEENLAELNLIRALRSMDMPMAELARIMKSRRSGVCHCTDVRTLILSKVDSINQHIREMLAVREELTVLLEDWHECGGEVISQN